MQLNELLESAKDLEIFEEREMSDEYVEIVFKTRELDQWIEVIESFLDAPVKPRGEKPTKEHKKITANYRGIEKNQILYKKDFEDHYVMAMLWPWGDGEHITLKLVRE